MPVLELERVHVHYGLIHALKGISLTVEAGEIVTLLGANGAGKTSTLRAISGLVRPSAGRILLERDDTVIDLTHRHPHEIVELGVGHVPEGRRVFPRLSVEENLRLGAFTVRDRREIARRQDYVFTLFPRLAERRRQAAGTLSGGEQQMLAIGRALMMQPRILLLDEPSMGLAPVLVESIFEVIQRLNREGATILLVEQNARMALEIAHRGYVLETGTITLSGLAAELASDPRVRAAYLGAA